MSDVEPVTSADRHGQERRGTGRTRRGRAARSRLLVAGRKVFERDGFLQARVADICEEAGLSQPSFYTYFHTKEELFDEIVGTVDFDLLDMPRLTLSADPVERLRAANRHYLEFYRDNAAIIAVIDQVVAFDENLRAERFEDSQQRFARAIERRIRTYQDEGLADPRVDPYFAALALGSMVTSVASRMFIQRHPGRDDFDHVVDQLTLLWANAIGLDTERDVHHEDHHEDRERGD